MRKWISHPHKEGQVARQAHADLPEDGVYERELGRSGFFGPTAHMHHKHAPTSWIDWQGPLRPRAYDVSKLAQANTLPWDNSPLLSNAHCQYRFWQCKEKMSCLVRNADGDDCLFVHRGEADFYCDYGYLRIKEGDYLIIPRGTMWRIEPNHAMDLLIIEATNDSFQLPDKGLLGPQAIFDSAMLDIPTINDAFKAQQTEQQWSVKIKCRKQLSTVTFPYNPLDAIGWHGDLSVVRINWRDIRPLMSHRYHLPPSAHTTFVAQRFVICTFVPRPVESDPGALKLPFYHNNDDFDEVIFYHYGEFMSRDNIKPGMVTFHPSGFTHGPHPKAFKKAQLSTPSHPSMLDEVAIMLDTRDALEIGDGMESIEDETYINSWRD